MFERFQKKLSGWKAKCLSLEGRLTLVESILDSLGSYLTLISLAHFSVLNSLESTCANIFWGVDLYEKRMHLVRCDKVLVAKADGGLGVGILFSFIMAMMICRWWRFCYCPDLLWTRVIKSLYGSDGGCRSLNPRSSALGPWYEVICMLTQI